VSWFHGGVRGLKPGDTLVPSSPHVMNGCPVCVARQEGRALTIGEYRVWLRSLGDRARPILAKLEGVDDREVIDPPSEREAVYITRELLYATWYAARSGHGDLYEVEPIGEIDASATDHFRSAMVGSPRIVRVLRRSVHLTRRERREIERAWRKADERAEKRVGV
jgi:hypothetical protein